MLRPFKGDAKAYANLPAVAVRPEAAWECGRNTPFGPVVVNIHDWRPGDVALVSTPESAFITLYQSLIGLGTAAVWTHAAIYAGNRVIWDAMPDQHIQARSVGELVRSEMNFALFRLRNTVFDSEDLGAILSEQAGGVYDLRSYVRTLAGRLVRAGSPTPVDEAASAQPMICSVFVERVLMLSCGRQVLPRVSVAVPGDFAASSDFESVPLYWCRCA